MARPGAALGRAGVALDKPGAWPAEICELAASAAPEARQRIVRAIVEPGSVVLKGRRVRLTMLAEAGSRGAGDAAAPAVLAVAPGCSSIDETTVIIRLVA